MAGAPSVDCDVGLEGIASGVGSSPAEESNVTFMTSEEQRKSSEWSLVVKHGRRRRNYVDGQKSLFNSELVKLNKGCLSLLLVQGHEGT